jgi:hypothetical protein
MKLILFFLLMALTAYAFEESHEWLDAASGIRNHLEKHHPSRKVGSSLCDSNTCCQLSSTESCSMDGLKQAETTMVLAPEGSDAKCIFGSQYGLQVIPGSTEKLLFYFQGGGACWDQASTAAGLCTSDIGPNAPVGVFDKNNDLNPFKDYTIVHALYCSGDVYAGNVTQPYKHRGQPVTQMGVANARFAIDWAREQGFGGGDGVLEEFVVMGCSAGSVGTQLWADQLMTIFPSAKVAVVPDSYAGLFPEGTVGPLMKEFGICDTDLVAPSIKPSCYAGNLDIEDVVSTHIAAYERSPFAFIQSKVDAVQQSFYVAMGLTHRGVSAVITPAKFYSGIMGIFGNYNKLPNFVTYVAIHSFIHSILI